MAFVILSKTNTRETDNLLNLREPLQKKTTEDYLQSGPCTTTVHTRPV